MTSAEGHVNSSLVAKFDQEAIRRAMVKMFTCCVAKHVMWFHHVRQSEDDGKLTIAVRTNPTLFCLQSIDYRYPKSQVMFEKLCEEIDLGFDDNDTR
ncbi:hypothetical protein L195_g038383 [Trifolium pratense]|uniref:Uncharacterized protein n=1 Tax=Trifolium pratense TaxID=57577 RepID=A0A2K3LUY7_TRIPR|nr:hypothetical protein L195_g038383 [Trifolium pratense]